ncbi:hypothetical protein [Streptomyces sp. NPDC096068]
MSTRQKPSEGAEFSDPSGSSQQDDEIRLVTARPLRRRTLCHRRMTP